MFVWQRLVIGSNKPTPFAVLAFGVTNHDSYIESKEFSKYIYDQSNILDLVTLRKAIA